MIGYFSWLADEQKKKGGPLTYRFQDGACIGGYALAMLVNEFCDRKGSVNKLDKSDEEIFTFNSASGCGARICEEFGVPKN